MPELWIHRSNSDLHFLDRDLSALRKRVSTIRIREVFALPHIGQQKLAVLAQQATDYLVDPCSHERYERRSRKQDVPKLKRQDYVYLFGPRERQISDAVPAYLEHARVEDTGVVICPCLQRLTPTNWQEGVRALTSSLEAMRDKGGSIDIMLELLLDKDLVANEETLEEVLGWLLPQEIHSIAARVQWPTPASYTELDDADVLRGCMSLVDMCKASDVEVYFPNTGLTGLLLTAYGAAGFGTGLTDSLQSWREKPFYRRTKGSSTRKARWFSSPLLSWIDADVQQTLVDTIRGYKACNLPCCTDGGLKRPERHYIWSITRLADRVCGADDPIANLRDRTARALQLWGRLGAVPSKAVVPEHLAIWAGILGQ